MKKTRILLLTSNDLNHPRSKSIKASLVDMAYLLDHITVQNNKPHIKAINYLSGRNFYLNTFFYLKKCLNYDTIILQNLHTLLLAPFLKITGKAVVYDILDDYPRLNQYNLDKKLPKLSYFFTFLSSLSSHIEIFLAKYNVNAVTVNSDYLFNRIKSNNKHLIYYCSPFTVNQRNFKAPPALLYLGIFSLDKGAKESISIARKHNLPLHIIGNITPDAQLEITNNSDVSITTYGRMKTEDVEVILSQLFNSNFFFGLSLIRSENPSYAVQEANKDIDYLALGIPIIGNTRTCTYEKIIHGGGLLYTDDNGITNALSSIDIKKQLVQQCLSLYQKYNFPNFKEQFRNVIRSVTP